MPRSRVANLVGTISGTSLNVASITLSSGLDVSNQANNAYAQANLAYGQANSSYSQANLAYTQANNAYGQANLSYTQANNAYGQANLAYTAANNRVLKAGDTMTGQLNISSGGLLVTGNVGIGNSSPTNLLELYNATNATLRVSGDSTSQINVDRAITSGSAALMNLRKSRGTISSPTAVASGDGIGNYLFTAYGGTNYSQIAAVSGFVGTYTSDSDVSSFLTFSTTPTGSVTRTERMRIDSAGNVGIGTVPLSKLHVYTTTNYTGNLTFDGVASIGSVLNIEASGNVYTEFRLGSWALTRAKLRVEGYSGAGSGTGGGILSLWTGDTSGVQQQRVTIDGAGSVGIGTTSVGGFNGTFVLGGSGNPTSGYLEGIHSNQLISSTVTTRYDGFLTSPSTAAASFTVPTIRHYAAQQGTFNSPSVVTNQYGFAADANLTGATNNFGFYSDIAAASNRWNFYANGTANNYFAGNVGIGMAPAYALDLTVGASNGIRLNASSGQCNIFLQQAGVTNGYINAAGGAGTDLIIVASRFLNLNGGSGGMLFRGNSAASESMRITPSGNLCIGTTGVVWDELLRVRPNSNTAVGVGVYTESAGYTGSLFRAQAETANGEYMLYEGRGAGGAVNYWVKGNGNTYFAGNVGIGTSSAGGKFVVQDGISHTSGIPTYRGSLILTNGGGNTTSAGGFEFHASTYESGFGWRLSTPDLGNGSTPLIFQSRTNSASWSEVMRLDNISNRVIIGTTTAGYSARLTVEQNANAPALVLRSPITTRNAITVAGSHLYMRGSDNGYGLAIGNYSAVQWLQGMVNDAPSLDIALNPSGGNVGVGTISPAYKLDVSGTARATFFYGLAAGTDDSANFGNTQSNIRIGGDGATMRMNASPWNLTLIAPSVIVSGALSKSSGSFKIDHPLPEKSNTHYLVHSFIEGPQADLIYSGKIQLENGVANINIDSHSKMTEGTFVVLCRDIRCFTTNESDWDAVRGSVTGNILTIECQNSSSNAIVSWMVIGERQDKHMLDTNWTDDAGKVIVEPEKT